MSEIKRFLKLKIFSHKINYYIQIETEFSIAPPVEDETVVILPSDATKDEILEIVENLHTENVSVIVGSTLLIDTEPVTGITESVARIPDEVLNKTTVVNQTELIENLQDKENTHVVPVKVTNLSSYLKYTVNILSYLKILSKKRC